MVCYLCSTFPAQAWRAECPLLLCLSLKKQVMQMTSTLTHCPYQAYIIRRNQTLSLSTFSHRWSLIIYWQVSPLLIKVLGRGRATCTWKDGSQKLGRTTAQGSPHWPSSLNPASKMGKNSLGTEDKAVVTITTPLDRLCIQHGALGQTPYRYLWD